MFSKRTRSGPVAVLGVVLVVILVWVIGGTISWVGFSSWETRAHFGDMFGAINALFAGLAFAGVIVALALQMRELALQRRELRLTRLVMRHSAKAQKASEKALFKQAESTVIALRLNVISNDIAGLRRMSREISEDEGFEGEDKEVMLKSLRKMEEHFSATKDGLEMRLLELDDFFLPKSTEKLNYYYSADRSDHSGSGPDIG